MIILSQKKNSIRKCLPTLPFKIKEFQQQMATIYENVKTTSWVLRENYFKPPPPSTNKDDIRMKTISLKRII